MKREPKIANNYIPISGAIHKTRSSLIMRFNLLENGTQSISKFKTNMKSTVKSKLRISGQTKTRK